MRSKTDRKTKGTQEKISCKRGLSELAHAMPSEADIMENRQPEGCIPQVINKIRRIEICGTITNRESVSIHKT